MKKFTAKYFRVESRVTDIECVANNIEEARTLFYEMIEEAENRDFDNMETVWAEDSIEEIEEVN